MWPSRVCLASRASRASRASLFHYHRIEPRIHAQVNYQIVKKLTLLFLVGLTCISNSIAGVARFFQPDQVIGCGTVTSVRKINQEPVFNAEYFGSLEGKGIFFANDVSSASQVIGATGFAGSIVVGYVAGALANAVKDARDGDAIYKVIPPQDGVWKNVFAVRIEMDDGRTLNMPLMNAPPLTRGRHYESGQRLQLTYYKQAQNIQVTDPRISLPKVGDSTYERKCSMLANKDDSDAALKAAENMVDESKIVNE